MSQTMPLHMFIKGTYRVCSPLGQGQLAYLGEPIQTDGRCWELQPEVALQKQLSAVVSTVSLDWTGNEIEVSVKFH